MVKPTDKELEEMIMLQAQIKQMQKRVDEIKKWCRDIGSFYTANYTVSVVKRTRTGLAGLPEVLEFIDAAILNKHGLIRESQYELVEVGIINPVPFNLDLRPASK